ncbi:MAG: hypothetical protein GEV11_13320 [Streptosporangiales bacterium]|nr:hypothetical protein [Streptosporangiales bacterium]
MAHIAYSGADYTPKDDEDVIPEAKEKLLSEKTTQGAAMAAARDVLRHLGGRTDGTPHVVESAKKPPVAAPTACALVSPSTLRRLGDARLATIGGKPEPSFIIEGEREDITSDACD